MKEKNNMKKSIIIGSVLFFLTAGLAFGTGSAESSAAEADSGLKVFVSVLPQTFLVDRIGGGRVDVEVLVSPGKSPATYEPTPMQVAGLGTADVLFTIGVPFEKAFLTEIENSLGDLPVVDTSEGIHKRHLDAHHHDEPEGEHHDEQGDGDHDEHEGEGADPHIWLSPVLMIHQAEIIRDSLSEADPEGAALYTDGFNSLKEDLSALDGEISAMLAPHAGNTLFIFHPTLGYFADHYGLHQVAIEADGKQPSAAELAEIIEHAREEDVKIIFVQPEFSQEAAGVIADAIGGKVVVLNPLNPDYINNLRDIASDIADSYK